MLLPENGLYELSWLFLIWGKNILIINQIYDVELSCSDKSEQHHCAPFMLQGLSGLFFYSKET